MRYLYLINIYEISLNFIDIMGDPWVPRDPNGHGFGHKTKPAMGHGFFNGQILFSWAWVWDGKTQRFVPVAISNRVSVLITCVALLLNG